MEGCNTNALTCNSILRLTCDAYRVLPAAVNLLSGVDLPGRAVLHSVYHASMYHQCGSLPQSALPHEVRAQQDQEESHPQDCLRVAPFHRHEPTALPHVLSGKDLCELSQSQYTRNYLR